MELLDEDYVITEATELEGSIYDETALKKYVVTIIPKGEKEGTVIKRGSEDIGRVYVGQYSNIIFSGNIYRYNLLMYIVGIALYFGLFIFLYKKIMEKSIIQLVDYSIPLRILAWVIYILWALVMFVTLIMVVFLKLDLSDNMEQEIMIWISIIGWPAVTALLIGMDIIGRHFY